MPFEKKDANSNTVKLNYNKLNASLLQKIIDANVNLDIEDVGVDGEIVFYVKLSDIGINKEDIFNIPIGDTKFFANFSGEYIVRQNVDKFSEVLSSLDSKLYNDVVTTYTHENFGMFVSKDRIKFVFHISLVEDILNEDINKIL